MLPFGSATALFLALRVRVSKTVAAAKIVLRRHSIPDLYPASRVRDSPPAGNSSGLLEPSVSENARARVLEVLSCEFVGPRSGC